MRFSVSNLILVCLVVLVPAHASAQWFLDGAPLTAVPGNQSSPAAVPDGAGGAIVVWADPRSGTEDIYVQRVSASGVALWAVSGVPICTAINVQVTPAIAVDGAGGAVITWADFRSGAFDIYVQRVNATGTVQWAANGVVLCSATNAQTNPQIVSDGAGGAIATWTDFRSGTNNDVFVGRVNGAGTPQWTANGVLLFTSVTDQDSPQIIADGVGGAIVTFRDIFNPADHDIWAQRVNSSGSLIWGAVHPGYALGNQQLPQITTDGAGGAIIAWQDARIPGMDIYAQRLNAGGAALWTTDGVALCQASFDQINVAIASDGAGGAVVVWEDYRGGLFLTDIFAQRISSAGAPMWTFDGVTVCNAPSDQLTANIVAVDGGVVASWSDHRSISTGIDIFAQRLDASGAAQWNSNGRGISNAQSTQNGETLISDGSSVIAAWNDVRSGGIDIYAQRIDAVYGYWGHPEPIITSVEDIPHDQGGKVAVNWTASDQDVPTPRSVDFYSVWRAVDALPLGTDALSLGSLGELTADMAGPVYLAGPGHYFERVGTQSAHGWEGYSFAASTRADSISGAMNNEVFMVAAHNLYDNYITFASNEVSGHSVDNLAPPGPLFLTAQRVGPDVHLNWNRVSVPDLRDYSMYRATASGVTPVPINFLSNSDDTMLVDGGAPSTALYYIVTAHDVHANQSDPSNEASVGALTGIGNTPPLTALTVLDNMPNPFASTTTLRVGLPNASELEIEVFDVAGRRVRAERTATLVAGWREISFDARDAKGRLLPSGVYFYRIKASGAVITRKMVITR